MAAVSTRFAPLPLTQPQSSCRSVSSFQGSESTKVYSLDDFVRDVKAHLGESGGIGCDEVDEDYLISLTQKYVSNPNDWARYYHNCPSKNYTRNAIVNINQKANIVSSLPPAPSLIEANTRKAIVGVESRKRITNSRSRQCALHPEGLSWRINRDRVQHRLTSRVQPASHTSSRLSALYVPITCAIVRLALTNI
jgi:hypothetical protein